MHNIKDLRKNFQTYKKKLLERKFNLDYEEFENLDNSNRKLISEKEKLEQEKKLISKSKEKSNFEKSKKISENILKISNKQILIEKKLNELLYNLPNLALDDVPVGKDEKSNKLIKKFGSKRKFTFNPKSLGLSPPI